MIAAGICLFRLRFTDPTVVDFFASEYFGCVRRCSNLVMGGGGGADGFFLSEVFHVDLVD